MSIRLSKQRSAVALTALLALFAANIIYQSERSAPIAKTTLVATACGQNIDCLAKALADIMEVDGIKAGLSEMNTFSEIAGLHCHGVSHATGKEMYKRVGKELLSIYEDLCDGGFTHGWMSDIGVGLSKESIVEIFGGYCKGSPTATACQHGIGHSLGENNVDVIVMADICVQSAGESTSQHPVKSVSGSCIEGWMMEKRVSFNWNNEKSLDEVLLLCDPLADNLQVYCAGQAYRLWAESGNNFKLERVYPLSKYCDTLDGADFQLCTIYLGEAIATIPLLSGDIETTITGTNIYCSLENENNRCLNGVLYVLSAGWINNDAKFSELCRALKKELVNRCFSISSNL